MNFTAPYRFVPLNKHVFIPHLVDGYPENISQDVPFKCGKDGSIEVEFTNITPILVAGDEKNGNLKEPQVIRKAGKDFFVIPGSSWKGMIRSVMEIMSFAKFQIYDDAYFGYRDIGQKQKNSDTQYSKEMQGIRCGWLYKKEDDYFLIPCGLADNNKIEIADVERQFRKYGSIKSKNIYEKLKSINASDKIRGWEYPKLQNGRYLVFTGYMNNKKHEYCFEDPSGKVGTRIEQKETIKKFFYVYHNSPYNDEKNGRKHFIEEWLELGKKLPVFYKGSENNITHIGFTRMYRLPYSHSVSDGINQIYGDDERDLVECIFGYTDTQKKSSLKGRVQFGHTLVPKDGNSTRSIEGVLAQPQASYYPFYLKQGKNEIQDYNAKGVEIAGYKRYAVHENSNIETLPQGNGNEKTLSELQFIPAGKELKFVVHFHNLLPEELGALLSAMSFHNTTGFYYNVGMAKGYGYGKLKLTRCELKINGECIEQQHFLSCYESLMEAFVESKYGKSWLKSEQILALFGIASGTIPSDELKVMEMNVGYKNGRDKRINGGRSLRGWNEPCIASCADPDDQNFQTLDLCALTYLNNKDFETAKQQFLRIISICKKEDYKVYAQNRINRIEKVLEQIALEWECAQKFEKKGEFEEASEHYKAYSEKSGHSVADEIAELNKKIDELKEAKVQGVLDEADQLKKSCKYAEAIEKYREYEQLTGLSKAQDILYCEKCLEEFSKSIAERLTYHASVAAFVNSLKKALAGRQSLTDDEMKEIGRNMAENVKAKDKIKWQNSASLFKGILSDEQVAELLNYIK